MANIESVDIDQLPAALMDQPFTIAMARAWGLAERHIQRMSLAAPTRGVRSATPLASVHEQCAAVALVLQDFAFSHTTAARLHGLPLPEALDDDRLHVMRDARAGAVRRVGTVGHRGLRQRQVATVKGLPVVGLADTWADLGELIRPGVPLGVDDLIVLGDAVAARLGSVDPLRRALEARGRPRGKLTLLEALAEVRVGSRSPGETRTRLVLVRPGLPEPELNVSIVSEDRAWLGIPDMRWRAERVLAEYQGREFHDGEDQRATDAVRFEGFAQDRWKVVEVWNDDINTDRARIDLVLNVAQLLGIPREALDLSACHPRFFSKRMLELAEIRSRRLRAQAS